jgi:hypothetical protein
VIVNRLPDSLIDTTVGSPYWAFQVPAGPSPAPASGVSLGTAVVLLGTAAGVPLGAADGEEAGAAAAGVVPARVKTAGDPAPDEKRAVRVLPESVNVVGVQEANEQLVVYQRPCCPE